VAENAQYLAKVDLFSSLPANRLEQLGELCRRIKLAPQEVLLREGESGSTLYIIIGGVMRVERYTLRGDLVHLAMRSAGDTIGELSILTDGYRSAFVVAHTPVKLLVMDRAPFLEYALSEPEVTLNLLSKLAERVKEASELVVSRSSASVEERLIQLMLSIVDATGEIYLSESQTELSTRIGCSRETLNRTIGKLVEDRKLERSGSRRYRWTAV
jgi:CRP/FNR family transcriptional regulator, cyclic AMP receptor protein